MEVIFSVKGAVVKALRGPGRKVRREIWIWIGGMIGLFEKVKVREVSGGGWVEQCK